MLAEEAIPDLTAIIIAFDVRDEVLSCLESLDRHRGALTLQTIFVDNASTDGTADAVAAAHPAVEIVRLASNQGVRARNQGLRRARGRHRMFIDSDATVTPGALQAMVDLLDADARVGLVGPRLVYPDGRLQLSARRFPPRLLPLLRRPPLSRWFEDSAIVRHHLMADDPPTYRRQVEYVLGACQMFSREAQVAAGQIDEAMWFGPDDADWCFKIRRAGFHVVYEPEAVVVHVYRRKTAANPLSRGALSHLWAFIHFQRTWRRERSRLVAEGRAMDVAATPPMTSHTAGLDKVKDPP